MSMDGKKVRPRPRGRAAFPSTLLSNLFNLCFAASPPDVMNPRL
jgi:hypothetical protein